MRWIFLIGLVLIAGCNAVVTQEQARNVCEEVGVSEAGIDAAISFAEQDKANGSSSGESMGFARDGCQNSCDDPDDDASCLSDCTTCANAVINFVYSQ